LAVPVLVVPGRFGGPLRYRLFFYPASRSSGRTGDRRQFHRRWSPLSSCPRRSVVGAQRRPRKWFLSATTFLVTWYSTIANALAGVGRNVRLPLTNALNLPLASSQK
jgi:hypothetical protein